MNFDELAQEAFATAKTHGWHDEEQPDETYLMLIITEIAEAVQADRKNKHADAGLFNADVETLDMADGYDRDVWKRDFEIFIKNTVEDELSDIVIRCLDLAGVRGKDIYIDEYMAKYVLDFIKREPSFPEVAYEMCRFAASTDESLGLSERIGCIISLSELYCKQKDIDIEFFIEQKMKYNRLREYKHGNKKY